MGCNLSTQTLDLEGLFSELGRTVYVFQAIEVRIKLLLPHLAIPRTGEPPADEGWGGRQKYLESKEMLGNLVRLLQERVSTQDPRQLEQEWRAVVQARNDVIHNFVLQPFARCATKEEVRSSIDFLRKRRVHATPMLQMLETLARGFLSALQLPPDVEGELPLVLPEWLNVDVAYAKSAHISIPRSEIVMPATKRIQFTATIKAPPGVVWRHVTSPESYRQWTSAFAEGSHFQGSWEAGAKILFLAPNGDGMVSEIAESRANQFLSIRHLGFIAKGVEDTTSEAVRAWAPAYENYTFIPTAEGTRVVVDQDVAPEWEEHIAQAWPKALEILRKLSESSSLA